MSESRTVTCDACSRDLTSTGNCNDYRLALVPESIPSRGGAVTDWMNYPAIEKNRTLLRDALSHDLDHVTIPTYNSRQHMNNVPRIGWSNTYQAPLVWNEHHSTWEVYTGCGYCMQYLDTSPDDLVELHTQDPSAAASKPMLSSERP